MNFLLFYGLSYLDLLHRLLCLVYTLLVLYFEPLIQSVSPPSHMRSLVQSSATGTPPTIPLVQATSSTHYTAPVGSSNHHPIPFGCQLIPPTHTSLPNSLSGPHSFFNVHNSSLLLSSHAKDQVSRAIQKSWANSTLKRYSGAIKQFIRFCEAEGVPERLRFPADEFVLCAFAASSFGRHAGGTPRSRLSALKAWHAAHNVKWNGSARLRFVLNGVRNSAPSLSKRPPRPPINATMLVLLIQNLDLNSPLDAAIAACAVVAFWGQCRVGELLPLSSLLPLPPLPTRSDFKRSIRNPHSCILRLPSTKTHRAGQDVVLVDQHSPINPISLLKNHIRVSAVHDSDFLFSFTSSDGPTPLTKRLFLDRCNEIWSTYGYPRTTGHCFRIGGTTELLILGTPPDVVKVMGRWSSDSFLRYWRSLEDIAPFHVRNIHSSHRRRIFLS